MFDTLIRGFQQAQNRLSGLTELTESSIETALREVRLSLLEADVEVSVVKRFLARVKAQALGKTVRASVKTGDATLKLSAADVFLKICHDELVAMMNHEGERIRFAPEGQPTGVLMVGLQGAGKTTSAAKVARLLRRQKKRPLLVAADTQRPAAVEQLKVLGGQLGVPVFHIEGGDPVDICLKGLEEGRKNRHDVVIFDTAGRLAVDEALMQQLDAIKAGVKPDNIFLVVDAMIGQDAVKTAKTFNDRLTLTGVVLTKLDGDARGGAALSVKEVTGVPPLFAGNGETLDKLEEFRAEGVATRILGLGDPVDLWNDHTRAVEEDTRRVGGVLKGRFSADDLLLQIQLIKRMGSLEDLSEKWPFPGGIPRGANLDDRELVKIEAVLQSMTRAEKSDVHVLIREPGRVKRICGGSGTREEEVHEVVRKCLFMQQRMDAMGQNLGMADRVPGLGSGMRARTRARTRRRS